MHVVAPAPGLYSSDARSPLATYFRIWATGTNVSFARNVYAGALDFQGLEIVAPNYFS